MWIEVAVPVVRRIGLGICTLLLACGLTSPVIAQGVSGRLPFDVESDRLDPNGLPLNPHWHWQADSNNAGKLPDPSNLCPKGLPDSPECTSQPTSENLPGLPKSLICMWEPSSPLIGHINWTPATYSGVASWKGRSTDRDTNWTTPVPVNGGLTAGNDPSNPLLDLEFASYELASSAHTPFWSEFWNRVQNNGDVAGWLQQKSGSQAPIMVATGQFGVDCEHNCHAELHPVYAMAVQLDANPNDNVWAIFVRNWGNEGFCAHGTLEPSFPANQMKMLLPFVGTSQPTAQIAQFTASSGIAAPSLQFVANQQSPGIVASFQLPPPHARGLVEIELHLKWPVGSHTLMPKVAVPPNVNAPRPEKNVEDFIQSQLGPSFAPTLNIAVNEIKVEQKNVQLQVTTVKALPPVQFQPVPVSYAADPIGDAVGVAIFEQLCRKWNGTPPADSNIPAGACASWQKITSSGH